MTLSTKKLSGRFTYIDCVRGLAAFYVLLQHTLEYAGFINTAGNGPYNWVANLGQAGVFAFFLVSGFVIPFSLERSTSSADFWTKRALRIYPLYLFIFALTLFVRPHIGEGELDRPALTLVAQLFFINSWVGLQDYVAGSWTLVIELMWYISLFLWWRITGGIHGRKLLLVALVFCVIVTVFSIYSPVRIPLGRLGMMLACCWGLFVLEYTSGRFNQREFWSINAVFVGVCLFIIHVGFGLRPSLTSADMFDFSIVTSSWGIGAATFFFFYAFRNSSLVCNRVFVFLGTISYSVYLVHGLVLPVLVYNGLYGFQLLMTGIPLSVALSILSYRFIEQPFIHLGRKNKHTAGDSAPAAGNG